MKSLVPPSLYVRVALPKGQLISKANCPTMNSSKTRMNEFVFTTMRRFFVRFLEEIEDTKKTFRNYLTFMIADTLHSNSAVSY